MDMKINRQITPNKHKNSIEYGQSLIEYALIIVMVSLVAVGSLSLLGTSINEIYTLMLCEIQNNDDCQTQVYFEEDFEDDFSDWKTGIWRGKKRDWWIEDGKLVSDRNASILFDGSYNGDYSILLNDVELSNTGKIWQGLSLHFNSSDEDKKLDGYAFRIQSSPEGDVAYFQEYVNGKPVWPSLSGEQPLPAGFDWDNPGDIRVDVQNDTFTGYINGIPIVQAQDNTYSEGQVGIASHLNSNVSIDSIQVETLGD